LVLAEYLILTYQETIGDTTCLALFWLLLGVLRDKGSGVRLGNDPTPFDMRFLTFKDMDIVFIDTLILGRIFFPLCPRKLSSSCGRARLGLFFLLFLDIK
jgi:hypothetical protein